MTIKRQPGNKQFSDSVEYNGVVYVRGFTADDKNASMKVQTQQVLAKIDKALAAHGTNKSKILSATIYITDMAIKGQMNEAWDAWTGGQNLPARATVGTLLDGGALVEIMVTAAK
jgi:enamine deaminase RidA (YjgF/YER057c/UK114 family)